MSKRAYNFCAGPAALPEAVLKRAQGELLDWHGKGLSVMEMSHRSDEFVSIATKAEQDLRDLLNIPSNYKVLFLQGGASQQFAQIPLNLLPESGKADYIDTGIWSQKAIEEASRYGHVNVAATAKPYDYFRDSRPERMEPVQGRGLRSLRAERNHRWPGVQSGSRKPATCHWWPTCPRTFSRALWISPVSA